MTNSLHVPGAVTSLYSASCSLQQQQMQIPVTHINSLISRCLQEVARATKKKHLTKAVNRVQEQIWNEEPGEQERGREQLVKILIEHILQSPVRELRLEAAKWLCLLMQSGLVHEPQQIFVPLVTAATQAEQTQGRASNEEELVYLRMIFDCLWTFRYPYAVGVWEVFPQNQIFYPLAPLITRDRQTIQAELLGIFAELPALNDEEIATYVLPVASTWSVSPDPEHRRLATRVLVLFADGPTTTTPEYMHHNLISQQIPGLSRPKRVSSH